MSILLQVIKESIELLEEASFSEITDNIVSKVASKVGSNEANSKPTGSWIAGLITALDMPNSKPLQLVRHMDRLNPESKEYRDAQRIKVTLDVLAQSGLINKTGDSYSIPSRQDRIAREKLSKYKQFVSSYVHKARDEADLTKQFRQGEDDSDRQWLASLPPKEQKLAHIYSELSPTDMAMLKKISFMKKDKRGYVDFIRQAELSGSNSIMNLKNLGFLKSDGILNSELVRDFKSFLNEEGNFARLRNLNKDMRTANKRITADQALTRNELEKKMDMSGKHQTEVSRRVGNIINSLSDQEKTLVLTAYRTGRINQAQKQALQKIGILDNAGEFTDKGKAVAAVLNVRKDVDMFSSTAIDNATERGTKADRRKERLQDRKRNFSTQTKLDI